MKKDDHRFHRDRKQQIENQSRENKPEWWQDSKPIYLPKKKKKKR